MNTTDNKFTCFVCGYKTLDSRCDWDICPICFWEDDVLVQSEEDDVMSPANGLQVSEAQANFIRFGAADQEAKENVRPPNAGDARDPDWRPMKRALRLAEED